MKITVIEAFQVAWSPTDRPQQHSAFVLVHTDTGLTGMGEASPMQGGRASPGMIREDIAPMLIGQDPLDHAVLLDQALHTLVKLGPKGALTGALAALDVALWDLKGKLTGLPIHKLIGGAWKPAIPFYASIGGNAERSLPPHPCGVRQPARPHRRLLQFVGGTGPGPAPEHGGTGTPPRGVIGSAR